MKRKRKITALLLTMLLLLTGTALGMVFAEAAGTAYSTALAASETEVLTGDTVTVDVLLQSDAMTAAPEAAEITVAYDQGKLSWQGSTAGAVESVRVTEKDGAVTVSYLSDGSSSEGWTLDGGSICVAHLTFQAAAAGLQPDGRYRVSVCDIAAHHLGTEYEVQVSAGNDFTIRASALSYANLVLNTGALGGDQDAE